MELVLFGIAIFSITFGLQTFYALRLDEARNELFELRDELRFLFKTNNIKLNDPIYIKMRNLINGHLKYLQLITLWNVIQNRRKIKTDKKVMESLQREINMFFHHPNSAINDEILNIRKKAANIVLLSAVKRNLIYFILSELASFIINIIHKMNKWNTFLNEQKSYVEEVSFNYSKNFAI